MADKKRRLHHKPVYQHHQNAVSISFYDPTGWPLPQDVRDELENLGLAVAMKNKLLINIAYE